MKVAGEKIDQHLFGPNGYLPDHNNKGEDSLNDLIRNMVGSIIRNLDDLQNEAGRELFFHHAEEEIKEDAVVLFSQIEALKEKLLALTQKDLSP